MRRQKYRVGIIGATGRGDYGHAIDVAFLKVDRVEVIAVADADEAGRHKAKARLGVERNYADYRQMLAQEKLDIVAICPRWIDQHHDMLMAAAEAGCHVYMEKPFCRNLEECDSVVTQFDMRHLKLTIAHISNYSPVLQTMQRLIGDGVIGDVLEIRSRGKEDHRGGGEDLWVLGSHVFGMMQILGGEPTKCYATVTQAGKPISKEHVISGAEGIGPLAGDHVQATYQLPGNVPGFFASKRDQAGNPPRFAVQLFGTQGIIELESGYGVPGAILRDSSWSPQRSGKHWEKITSAGIGNAEPLDNLTYEAGHVAAINDLIAAIDQNGDTKINPRQCTTIIEMIAAIFESQRLGKPVSMPLTTRVNPLTLIN